MTELEREAEKLTELLKGKAVRIVWRHRPGEIAIEFDGDAKTRLFVTATPMDWIFLLRDRDCVAAPTTNKLSPCEIGKVCFGTKRNCRNASYFRSWG